MADSGLQPVGTEAAPVARRRRIHVLHVVRRGVADGGMENGIVNVANRLPIDEYRISVCALDTEETFSSRIRRADSEYYVIPKRGSGIDWRLIARLAQTIRRCRADLVHSHNWGTFLYAVLAAKWTGTPVIHGEHGKNWHEIGEEGRLKRWAKSLLGPGVDGIVTVSQTLAAEWAAYGVPEKKIHWIPNGVDAERFRPRADSQQQRRMFGLPDRGLLVGSIGRLDELKNYQLLLNALAIVAPEFPDLNVALLGRGPCEAELRGLAARLGLSDRVFFLGHRPDPEEFLAALDIFALPSKFEGMSNVVLEAMATGLAVICCDLPAHREVFEPEREGVLVVPCSADSFARSLAALCRDAGRRTLLGGAARAKAVSRYTISRMVSDYDRVYEQCCRVGRPL